MYTRTQPTNFPLPFFKFPLPRAMRQSAVAALSILALSTATASTSWAQDDAAFADPGGENVEEGASSTVPAAKLGEASKVRHGIGLRLRYIFVPKALIELFMESAPSGVSQKGFGLDYVRRKGDFEFSAGFEYDTLSPQDGYFVERGGNPQQPGTTDLVEFKDLSWFTIDASLVYHHKLSDLVSLRYGGGLGFGIVTGDIIDSDAQCTGPDLQGGGCRVSGPQIKEKQKFFRYPPVFNLLGGVQLTPSDKLAINIELGMRTVFYTGVGVQYFF